MHGSVALPITRIWGKGEMPLIFKIGEGHRWFTLGSNILSLSTLIGHRTQTVRTTATCFL